MAKIECPVCGGEDHIIRNTRKRSYGTYRRLECRKCHHTWSFRGIDERLTVAKRAQKKQPVYLFITMEDGKTYNPVELGNLYGLAPMTIRQRYNKGLRGAELVRPAFYNTAVRIDIRGKMMTFNELAAFTETSASSIKTWYYQGLRGEELLAKCEAVRKAREARASDTKARTAERYTDDELYDLFRWFYRKDMPDTDGVRMLRDFMGEAYTTANVRKKYKAMKERYYASHA